MNNRDLTYCVYTLKRLYGQPATINKRTIGAIDYETGKQTIIETEIKVNRAILLPVSFYTLQSYALLANKFGADIQVGDRQVVIDYKDINVSIDVDDQLSINNKLYTVVEILDLDVAYQLLLRNTQGENS